MSFFILIISYRLYEKKRVKGGGFAECSANPPSIS
jgi:hypothetical protein